MIKYFIYFWSPPTLAYEEEVEVGKQIVLMGREKFLELTPYLSQEGRSRNKYYRNLRNNNPGRYAWTVLIAVSFFAIAIYTIIATNHLANFLIVLLIAGVPIGLLSIGSMMSARARYRRWVDEMVAKYAAHMAKLGEQQTGR
jgi:hypothetical protein